ncbi:hypothetical protein A9Q99_22530 [Gammaproteobacteria bacterium 45_16_T64]|nr:hypothetical protein A9Q99_22530 [Gammaproteobacteria bacterium 45_16_T64]
MKLGSNNKNLGHQNISENQTQLQHFLTEVMDKANIKDGAIRFYKNNEIDTPLKSLELSFEFGKTNKDKCKSIPILYQRKIIGDLLCEKEKFHSNNELINFPQITKTMALLFKRFKTNESAGQSYSQRPVLIGYSQQSLKLESFIEKAASASFPVIIEGDIGNEMSAIAHAIHSNSPTPGTPYVEIDCSTSNHVSFDQRLMQSWEQAMGGTLYLHEINELSLSQQSLLIGKLASDVKIIVSSTKPLHSQVNNGDFYRQLYTALDFLKIHIPPLKERKEDIPYMVNLLLLRYRQFDLQTLSESTLQELYNFDWPGNFIQLERVIIKLLTFANSNPIKLNELHSLLPEIIRYENDSDTYDVITHDDIIESLIKNDYRHLSTLHKSLEKSLIFLAENYYDNITLDDLANSAHVSASHLSFLFKNHLNKSFKKILAEIRIEHAKCLFQTYPHKRITDASLEVGFGDLSHFEKIFKRHTNMTPRNYKNSVKKTRILQ